MKVTVFFDLEGTDHNPCRGDLDMEAILGGIVEILDEFGVKAVFNTCGVVVEKYPDVVLRLHEAGHEISSHGYQHENFSQLTPDELEAVLKKTEDIMEDILGKKPVGVRCPWLVHNDSTYEIFEKMGYKWVSNSYFTHKETWTIPKPFSICGQKVPAKLSAIRSSIRSLRNRISWNKFRKEPYVHNGLVEIPMVSTMDGNLLFYQPPHQPTHKAWLDYAYTSLISQFSRVDGYFNLNFHPWVIGSSNRPPLLRRLLSYITESDVEFVLAGDLAASCKE